MVAKHLKDIAEVPPKWRVEMKKYQRAAYLIDGEWVDYTGPIKKVYSPLLCQTVCAQQVPVELGHYALLTPKESLLVLESAKRAWDKGRGLWPNTSLEERIEVMLRFAKKMQEEKEELIKILMWEIGKNLQEATKEVVRTLQYIDETIQAAREMQRTLSRPLEGEEFAGLVRRTPLGIVLCLGPYNYPINETFTNLIPALLMGNVVIFKPPRLGVLSHYPLMEAWKCFPPGVVNIIFGEGESTISPLMKSGDIDVLAFIGTSKVASKLKQLHPFPHRLRAVLGLEAKNIGLYLPDCPVDLAVQETLSGTLGYNGQRCTALKLLFVHKSLANSFVPKLVSATEALSVGLPWLAQLGPLPVPDKGIYLQELLQDALQQGARLLTAHDGDSIMNGNYFYPTIVDRVHSGMRLFHEEQFGPLVPIVYFENQQEITDYLRHTPYGQQASIFTQSEELVASYIDILSLQVSRINLNAQCQRGPDHFPFTGRKNSAEATLSVADALRAFSIRTVIAYKQTIENERILKEIDQKHLSQFL